MVMARTVPALLRLSERMSYLVFMLCVWKGLLFADVLWLTGSKLATGHMECVCVLMHPLGYYCLHVTTVSTLIACIINFLGVTFSPAHTQYIILCVLTDGVYP